MTENNTIESTCPTCGASAENGIELEAQYQCEWCGVWYQEVDAVPVDVLEGMIEVWKESTESGDGYSNTLQSAWNERTKRANQLEQVINEYRGERDE